MSNLKEFRTINNLTQVELAKYLGVSHLYISQIENGRVNLSEKLREKILNNDKGWDISPFDNIQQDSDDTLLTPNQRIAKLVQFLYDSKEIAGENELLIRVRMTKDALNKILESKRNVTDKVIDKFCLTFRNINRTWLITGEGNMISKKAYNTQPDNTNTTKMINLLMNIIEQKDLIIKQQQELISQLTQKKI